MVQLVNFSVFCINYIFMSLFTTYIWLTVSNHNHRKPAALYAVYALSTSGILLLIITQFTGLFYYFDDHNRYHRGNYYLLSQAIAVLGIALCLFMLISYRKNLNRTIFLSMMSFFVLPVLATIYQALAYGFSLQCLAAVISTQKTGCASGAAGKCEEDENHIKRNNQRNNYHIDREFHRAIHIVTH